MASGRIEIGKKLENGQPVVLEAKTRATHMQVIGASGRGKSKFLEHLIRRDILNDAGLCLIDPHGHLYEDLVRWCETKGFLGRKKIILFDPGDDAWAFGFNPLDFGDRDASELAFCVDSMVKACAQVWGGEDTNQTPRLKRCLRAIFHVLAEKRFTLLEALPLVSVVDEHGERRFLTQNINDYVFRQQWEEFNVQKEREYQELFASTTNRLIEFLAAPIVRRTIGQRERIIDFRMLMDEGYILLVNLASAGKLSDDNARLLGTLMVNDLFLKARGRPKGSRPFYLYIDECARYVNEDIGRILDEARKFGLHLILAHQHLAQLKKAGEAVYSAIMTNAQTKVIFGGLTPEDARVMAEMVFMGEYDLEEAKHSYDKPTVVRYIRTWFENESRGEGRSESRTYGTGESESESASEGRSDGRTATLMSGKSASESQQFHPDDPATPLGLVSSSLGTSEGMSSGTSSSSSSSRTRSTARSTSFAESSTESWSESRGRSMGLEPIMETMTTQGYSLEEQIYRSMALMINQPTQEAIVKIPNRSSVQVRTPDVVDGVASQPRVEIFKEKTFQLSEFVSPAPFVEEQLAKRRVQLVRQARGYLYPREPEKSEDFLQ